MRTLIYTAFVSLDGVVDSPGAAARSLIAAVVGPSKTSSSSKRSTRSRGREQEEAAAMMMGRVSYEAFSPIWPDMEEFADYKVMPKYIVSTKLNEDNLVSNWGEITISALSTR